MGSRLLPITWWILCAARAITSHEPQTSIVSNKSVPWNCLKIEGLIQLDSTCLTTKQSELLSKSDGEYQVVKDSSDPPPGFLITPISRTKFSSFLHIQKDQFVRVSNTCSERLVSTIRTQAPSKTFQYSRTSTGQPEPQSGKPVYNCCQTCSQL